MSWTGLSFTYCFVYPAHEFSTESYIYPSASLIASDSIVSSAKACNRAPGGNVSKHHEIQKIYTVRNATPGRIHGGWALFQMGVISDGRYFGWALVRMGIIKGFYGSLRSNMKKCNHEYQFPQLNAFDATVCSQYGLRQQGPACGCNLYFPE